jgi:hypothetical protein
MPIATRYATSDDDMDIYAFEVPGAHIKHKKGDVITLSTGPVFRVKSKRSSLTYSAKGKTLFAVHTIKRVSAD